MINIIDKDNIEFDHLKKDFHRRFIKFKNNSVYWKLKYYYNHPQYRTLLYYRLSKAIKQKFIRRLFHYLYDKSSKRFGLEILTPELGGGVIMPHWGRILINAEEVGDNLYIFHNVTIGNDYKKGRPKIGKNVFIGAASVIIGDITIGDNVVIGANSCVLVDIPSNSLVVGNPAKVVKNIDPDYIQQMIGY